MDRNTSYEYEIDLKDLCVSLLRKWRQIILVALLGAILLGGFRLVKNVVSEPGLVMSDSELETAKSDIDAAQKQITSLEASIASAESSISANEKTIENLDDKIALAESLLDNLYDYLENYTAALDKMMESEDLVVEIFDTMSDYLLQIDTIQSSILAKETEISDLYDSGPELEKANQDLQEQIVDYEKQISEQEEIIADLEAQMEEEASVDALSKVLTYAILGAVIGICCVCLYVFLVYCFDKTIHLEEDLYHYTGKLIIASIKLLPDAQKRKKNRIDRLLDRMSGASDTVDHSMEKQSAIAAAKIQLLSQKKMILVTGTLSADLMQEVCDNLRNDLPENEFEVVFAFNLMYNAEAILKIKDYELVLVEAPRVTKVNELNELNSFLERSGANVIGMISVTE